MRRTYSRRQVERALLVFVSALLAFGFALVYGAKSLPGVTAPITTRSVNVNTAGATQMAQTLAISLSLAQDIIRYRNGLSGGVFPSVYSVRACKLLRDVTIAWHPADLYVRTASEVRIQFLLFTILLVCVFWIVHFATTRYKPNADPFIVPLVLLLAGIGVIMVFSVKDPLRDSLSFVTQARGIIVYGLIAAILPQSAAFGRLPLHRYGFAYAVGAIALMLLLMSPLGHGPGGAKVMALGFEPVEIIKVLLVFFVASYLAERRMAIQSEWRSKQALPEMRDLIPLGAIYLFVLLLFALVKDMGPAVLLYGTFVTLVYLVTGRTFYPIAATVLLLLAGVAGYYLHFGFFATRVEMWRHPWDNSERLGGQLAMGLWGLATGGIFGTGLGLGDPAVVPRAGSDMVFTSIGEELGLAGSLTVLAAYAFLVYRGFRIALRAADDFDRLLAAGLTTLIGIQAIVITAGTTGLAPLTGVTLPFVSYGTSSLVADFFSVGVLIRLSAKLLPQDLASATGGAYPAAARVVVTSLCAALLLGVGGHLIYVQGIADGSIATRALSIPDADGITRRHYNPRLEEVARTVPRGRILDCNGKVLARNASTGEIPIRLFCDRPRVYPYGQVGASLVYAVEQPRSISNPMGSDDLLSGLGNGAELLMLYRRKDLPWRPTPQGSEVRLTVDIDLQAAAQSALDRTAASQGNGRGAAVALDVRSGALLAAATTPSFDPSSISQAQWIALHQSSDPTNPLLNRAFAGLYPPGSTFKLVTAASALASGHEAFRVTCRHTVDNVAWSYQGHHYLRRRITDEAGMPTHGDEGMEDALRVSCNVYFSQLAILIGPEEFERQIQAFQFSHCPPLPQLAEDLPDAGYGQGRLLVTPYEMARVVHAIANNGVMEPSRIVNGAGQEQATTPISPDNASQIGRMMRNVVTDGTARGAFDDLGVDVAGKTGSAQISHGKTHSWFAGFAPYESPKIAFACVIEHGGYGRTAAASVCREIIRQAIKR